MHSFSLTFREEPIEEKPEGSLAEIDDETSSMEMLPSSSAKMLTSSAMPPMMMTGTMVRSK